MKYVCYGCQDDCIVETENGHPECCLYRKDLMHVDIGHARYLRPVESTPCLWNIIEEDGFNRCHCGEDIDLTEDLDETHCINCQVTTAELRCSDE